jgi:Uncharacterized conserved protein
MTGEKIVSREGEELGTLQELMIDLSTGHVNYAVLSFSGCLGFGDKLFAIPWPALTLNAEEHTFTLHVDKDELADAPGFEKDNWPGEAEYESGWLFDLYEYYGYIPYWMQEPEWERV